MKRTHRTGARLYLAACLFPSLVLLTGCQGDKIVARVDNQPITEKEFYEQVMMVRQNELTPEVDAGGATLIRIIREKMTERLAIKKGGNPNDEDVRLYSAYVRRREPTMDADILSGKRSEEEFVRSMKFVLQEFGIGTEGAKASKEEVSAEFTKQKEQMKIPEMWTIRVLPAPSLPAATTALEQLKKDGDFKKAAQSLNLPPQEIAIAGKDNTAPKEQITPQLRTELEKLKDGQFADKPLPLSTTDPQTGIPRNLLLIIQLVKRSPEYYPNMQEIRPLLEQAVAERKNREWRLHKDQELAKYTKELLDNKAIQINIKRYQPLLDTVLRQSATAYAAGGGTAPAPSGMQPAPGGSMPQSAPSPAPAPSGGAPAGGAPPAGGMGKAPGGN